MGSSLDSRQEIAQHPSVPPLLPSSSPFLGTWGAQGVGQEVRTTRGELHGGPMGIGSPVSSRRWAGARHSRVAPLCSAVREAFPAGEVPASAKGYPAEVIALHSCNVLAFLN